MNTKLLIICLLISSAVFGQPGYTKINARYSWLSGKFDSSLHIPGYATTPNYRTGAWVGAGNVGIDTVANKFYYYSSGRWIANATYQVSPNQNEYYPNIYHVPFANTNFYDSTLVSLLTSSSYYYNGSSLWLNGTNSSLASLSRIITYKYGVLSSGDFSQKLLFQVGDSSSYLSLGIGVYADIYLSSAKRSQGALIDCVLGDSTGSYLYNFAHVSTANARSFLINKGDYIELQMNQESDSVTVYLKNLTSGQNTIVNRLVNLSSTNDTRNMIGHPTIYFYRGNVRVIDFSVEKKEGDYFFLGNSITEGYATSPDSSFVDIIRNYTNARVNNMARGATTTSDYCNVIDNFNFHNKTVFLSGINGNDRYAGILPTQSKANYDTIVSRLRRNNNKIVHIDNPYRSSTVGAPGWAAIDSLNQWIVTTYSGIDSIVTVSTVSVPTVDGVHPSTAGHAAIANRILSAVPWLFELNTADTLWTKNLSALGISPLSFYTAGTQRMVIDASGNVGIGTGTPAGIFHVSGQSSDNKILFSGDSGGGYNTFTVQSKDHSGDNFGTVLFAGDAETGVNFQTIDGSGLVSSNVSIGGGGGSVQINSPTYGTQFTGNVGIGTTPDSSNLKTGSFSLGYHKVTANNYITQPGDYTLSVDNGASNWNVYLPTAAGNPGRVIVVKRYDDNSSGTITVMATGGSVQDTDGSFFTQSLNSWPTGFAMFQSNGTNWEYVN